MDDKKKSYCAVFSYYSEEYDNFDSMRFNVQAENEFEARKLAWEAYDVCSEKPFMSCVRLCGLVWAASPLDVQDYFNALAASDKLAIKEIEYVDYPNDEIAAAKAEIVSENAREAARNTAEKKHINNSANRSYCYGGLYATAMVSEGMYKSHGIIPPQIFEEIHYAKRFAELFNQRGEYDKEAALYKTIDKAEKWDNDAIFIIREMFRSRSFFFEGEYYPLEEQFGKNGICPENADVSDSAWSYVRRWCNVHNVDKLSKLPTFDGQHVIVGSTGLYYEYRTLVLKQDGLYDQYRTPENLLWTPREQSAEGDTSEPIGKSPNAMFYATNLITGEEECWERKDFHGVLRPEYDDNISFEALRKEYAAEHADERDNDGFGDEQDDERVGGDLDDDDLGDRVDGEQFGERGDDDDKDFENY